MGRVGYGALLIPCGEDDVAAPVAPGAFGAGAVFGVTVLEAGRGRFGVAAVCAALDAFDADDPVVDLLKVELVDEADRGRGGAVLVGVGDIADCLVPALDTDLTVRVSNPSPSSPSSPCRDRCRYSNSDGP